jgi:hypothetical protein
MLLEWSLQKELGAVVWVGYITLRIGTSKGNKQKSSKTMKMKMFSTLDKARPHTENIRGLNLAAVTCTTVQVSKLPY